MGKRRKRQAPVSDGCVKVEPYGRLYTARTTFLRQFIGNASGATGLPYELAFNLGGTCPIIKSLRTGKYFTINWTDIINMAVAAGIDKEGELDGEKTDHEADGGGVQGVEGSA